MNVGAATYCENADSDGAPRNHHMKDLRPYICTFPKCSYDPGKLYSSRHAWFEHELAFHRRQWHCPFDCVVFSDFSEFDSHLKEEHPGRVDAVSFQVLSRGKEIPTTAEAKCPFCSMTLKSRRDIESHIGEHEERIALMALSSMSDYHDIVRRREQELSEREQQLRIKEEKT